LGDANRGNIIFAYVCTQETTDSNVSNIVLPGNIYTSFTGLGVYYPDGRETQKIGIIPDIEVKPTIRGVR